MSILDFVYDWHKLLYWFLILLFYNIFINFIIFVLFAKSPNNSGGKRVFALKILNKKYKIFLGIFGNSIVSWLNKK